MVSTHMFNGSLASVIFYSKKGHLGGKDPPAATKTSTTTTPTHATNVVLQETSHEWTSMESKKTKRVASPFMNV
jgi:hypothetical protein